MTSQQFAATLIEDGCHPGIISLGERFEFTFTSSYKLYIYYGMIHSIERKSTNDNSNFPLHLISKNFITYKFVLSQAAQNLLYEKLLSLVFVSRVENLLAFKVSKKDRNHINYVFDFEEEYKRMGVGTKTDKWRISRANSEFNICPTYPKIFAVPSDISDNVLVHAAKFRSKGRIPVLSYLYPKNMASITRCSQPMVGLKSKRSIQDEKMIEAIFNSNSSTSNLIIDARPLGNAMANRALGAGTENIDNYKNCQRLFMGIENIHVMRDSVWRLHDLVCSFSNESVDKWITALDSTVWYKHLKTILDSAALIVKTICSGNNVLIHCSDGWDRTAQLSSLACVCLDPYYRTIKGIISLVEKEWISFGFKFSNRCGHLTHKLHGQPLQSQISPVNASASSKEEKESSPVFLQFLDCLHSLLVKFPYAFEYNEILLIDLYTHCHSCQFGTFLMNCEKERMDSRIKENTICFWSLVFGNPLKYTNLLYEESIEVLEMVTTSEICFFSAIYSKKDSKRANFELEQLHDEYLCLKAREAILKDKDTSGKYKIPKKPELSKGCEVCKAIFVSNYHTWCFKCMRPTCLDCCSFSDKIYDQSEIKFRICSDCASR